MKVADPYNCVVGCDKCGEFCPTDALEFPSKQELQEMIAELKNSN